MSRCLLKDQTWIIFLEASLYLIQNCRKLNIRAGTTGIFPPQIDKGLNKPREVLSKGTTTAKMETMAVDTATLMLVDMHDAALSAFSLAHDLTKAVCHDKDGVDDANLIVSSSSSVAAMAPTIEVDYDGRHNTIVSGRAKRIESVVVVSEQKKQQQKPRSLSRHKLGRPTNGYDLDDTSMDDDWYPSSPYRSSEGSSKRQGRRRRRHRRSKSDSKIPIDEIIVHPQSLPSPRRRKGLPPRFGKIVLMPPLVPTRQKHRYFHPELMPGELKDET